MNWKAIGAVAEAFGAIGVIVTLVQIRQNSKLIKLSNTYQILDASRQSFFGGLGSNQRAECMEDLGESSN